MSLEYVLRTDLELANREIQSLRAQLAEAERLKLAAQEQRDRVIALDAGVTRATIERETLERAAKVCDNFHTHSCDMAAVKIRALFPKPEAAQGQPDALP